ncbi:peptidoglycan-binding protein [Luteimonas sp. MJ174]|uniref:peptidoglycan-binding protein n=1 Tax=Luteimonas sp. MJ174 TaxID=3129237 RepID=UPI0031BAA05E
MSNGEGRSIGGFGIDRESSVNLIVRTALDHGVSDPKQIAYMLATAQHETRDFAAPEEDYGRSQARKLGYRGGEDFYGRGYVHLTHDYNYRKFDELLGLDGELVKNPDRAKEPELAAQILVIGMRDGLFTGRRLDRYINDDSQDAYNARRVVNGITSQAWTIKAAEDCEQYATVWEQSVPMLIEKARKQDSVAALDWNQKLQRTLDGIVPRAPAVSSGIEDGLPDYLRVNPVLEGPSAADHLRQGARGDQVRALQSALDGLGIRDGRGRALTVDGIFGSSTRQAVENFQLWNGLETSGVVDSRTRELLHDPRTRAAAVGPGEAHDAADPARALADPTNPSHPDHAMYERIRSGVRAIDEANGKPYDEASERISRSLLVRCKGASACPDADAPVAPGMALRRVDHVLMGTTGNVFAIEGRLDDPAHRRASVSAAEAALVTVQESDRQLAAVNTLGEREHDVVRQQAAALRPGHPSAGLPCMAG